MTYSTSSTLALQLATFAISAGPAGGGALPLLDGLSASLGLQGVSFMARPLKRAPGAIWVRQTPTFRALGPGFANAAEPWDFVLVVQWRRLMTKALLRHEATENVSPALRRLAHRVWWTLLPLLEEHDVVLAPLLTKAFQNFRGNPRADIDPYWVGFDTEDDERRFDAQVCRLLASRRCAESPHDGFCEVAARWLSKALYAVTNHVVQRTVGHCVSGQHQRGSVCPTCPEIAQERPFLLALDVPAMLNRQVRHALDATTPETAIRAPSVIRDNLSWILCSVFRRDGVSRFEPTSGARAHLINVQRLWARWQELGMPTMFDNIPAMDRREGPRQAAAYFKTLMGGAVVAPYQYSLEALYVDARWGSAEDLAVNGEQILAVYESTLLQALARADQRAAALVKAQMVAPRPERVRIARRVITRTWAPLLGEGSHRIGIIRATSQGKRRANFYTLPYHVDDDWVTDRQARVGRGILNDGQMYWTAHAINHFANKMTPDYDPIYPWAREFCEWVGTQEPLLADDKLFNAAVYDDRLPQRLNAIALGEMAHLGMYSLQEDAVITEFFVDNPPKKRLAAQDWAPLLRKLPGRTERGILKRFEDLGKKYAFTHGYQVYAHSPYCRKFAAARRKQWIKEGCPP